MQQHIPMPTSFGASEVSEDLHRRVSNLKTFVMQNMPDNEDRARAISAIDEAEACAEKYFDHS